MKKREDLTSVLSELLKVNNDRIGIYRDAMRKINEHDLKIVFQYAVEESKRIEAVLALEIFKRNSVPNFDATTTTGKSYRIWMEIKEFFTGKSYQSILGACKFSERCIQKAYRDALQHEDVSFELSQILNEQTRALRKSQKLVRTHPVVKSMVSHQRMQGAFVKA